MEQAAPVIEGQSLLGATGHSEKPTGNGIAFLPPKRLSHGAFYRQIFWKQISWRAAGVLIFNILIMAVLYQFEQMGELSSWERRGFNALTILLTSLMSLSLGSLFTFLGTMIRWPLLAEQSHSPSDVDLILGISSPSGSLMLIWHHVHAWTMGRITYTALIYLFVNIGVRLSVASFGLTFELHETAGVEFPVMIADWRSSDWLPLDYDGLQQVFSSDSPEGFGDLNRFYDYATLGLISTPITLEPIQDEYSNERNISQMGIDRNIENTTVTYSYLLREYQGLEERSTTDKLIRSSSRCDAWVLRGERVYNSVTNIVGNISTIDADSTEYLRALNAILSPPITTSSEPSSVNKWMTKDNWANFPRPSGCLTTYIYTEHGYETDNSDDSDGFLEPVLRRNGTFFECRNYLTDQNNNPGVGTDVFEHLSAQNSSLTTGLLLRIGVLDTLGGMEMVDSLNDTNNDWFLFREYQQLSFNADILEDLNMESFWVTNAMDSSTDLRWPVMETYAAHLSARLPILAVVGAEQRLPRVTREPGASTHPFVKTELEVNWPRAFAILASILLLEVVCILYVFIWCRHLLLPDHESYFAMARLLRTTMNKFDSRSLDTGKEIAERMGEGVSLRYGARQMDDNVWEADLLGISGTSKGITAGDYR